MDHLAISEQVLVEHKTHAHHKPAAPRLRLAGSISGLTSLEKSEVCGLSASLCNDI